MDGCKCDGAPPTGGISPFVDKACAEPRENSTLQLGTWLTDFHTSTIIVSTCSVYCAEKKVEAMDHSATESLLRVQVVA